MRNFRRVSTTKKRATRRASIVYLQGILTASTSHESEARFLRPERLSPRTKTGHGWMSSGMTVKYYDDDLGKMRRRFLPVGQGAFYCETFELKGLDEPINIVFDCGSLPAKSMPKRLQNAVPLALGGMKTIHLVFLSHLDEDHVNGLEKLQNSHHIKINEIRYPAIIDEDKPLMDYWHRVSDQAGGLAEELCMGPSRGRYDSARFPDTRLIPIPAAIPGDPIPGDDDPSNPNVVKLAKLVTDAGAPKEVAENSGFSDWLFRTFNHHRDEVVKRLKKELGSILAPNPVTNDNLRKLWEKRGGKAKIKGAYRKAMPEGFNTNSMVVYSGPRSVENQGWHQVLMCCHEHPCALEGKQESFEPGCLYTGDYDASSQKLWDELHDWFEKYWQTIGCLQVPHHGSCLNFNERFLEMCVIFVASAGAHNQFGHPNGCVW